MILDKFRLQSGLNSLSNDDLIELLKIRDYHNQKFNQLKPGMRFLLISGYDDFEQEIIEIDYHARTFVYVDHSIKINSEPVKHTSAYNVVPTELFLDSDALYNRKKFVFEEYRDNNGSIHLPKQFRVKKLKNPFAELTLSDYNKNSLQHLNRMKTRSISHTTGICCAKCGFSNKVDNRGILPFIGDMLNNQLVSIRFKCSNCDEDYDLGLLSLIKKQF